MNSVIVKLAAQQGFAFIVGLLFVTFVQPETTGGALLLIAVGFAIVNVIITVIKLFFGGKGKAQQDVPSMPIDKDD
jgi:hypothetical protein